MAVRWYIIAELLAERGIKVNYSTINRWVIKHAPQLAAQFNSKRKTSGKSWRMDETYIIDCYFSKKRDKKAATKFFTKAIVTFGKPANEIFC